MSEFKAGSKESYKVWSLPKEQHTVEYVPITLTHPTKGKPQEFLVSASKSNPRDTKLLIVNQLAWTTPKSQSNEGKAFKTLLITNTPDRKGTGKENQDVHDSAVVLGEAPIINVATPFSLTYILASHYLDQMRKINHLEQESSRMVSFDDLLDTVCDSSEEIRKLVHEHHIDMAPAFHDICEVVTETFGGINEEEAETFFRLTKGKILEYVRNRVEKLARELPSSLLGKLSLDLKIDESTAIAHGTTGNINNQKTENGSQEFGILHLAKLEQAVKLAESYIDAHYTSLAMSDIDWTPLRAHLRKISSENKELRLAEQSIENLAQSSGIKAKRLKPTAKKITVTKVHKVAKGKGALDLFFASKKTS